MGGRASSSQSDNFETKDTDFVPIPVESIPKNRSLPFPVYIKISGSFVLFRSKKDIVSDQREGSLLRKGVQVLYILKNDWDLYCDRRVDDLIRELENVTEDLKAGMILRDASLTLLTEIDLKRELTRKNVQQTGAISVSLAKILRNNPRIGNKLLRRFEDPALYYVNHCFNVGIYAASIGHELKLSAEELKSLVLGGFLHNIGYIFIPKEVLNRKNPLNREELELVQNHPSLGADYLEKLRLPKDVILMTKQHHEQIDGRGYPNQTEGNNIHLFAKVCSIADVYDALLSARPHYTEPHTPQLAIAKMRSLHGKFEPSIFSMMNWN